MHAAKHKNKEEKSCSFLHFYQSAGNVCREDFDAVLTQYVGQHTLIIMILRGVTDTRISIYINKWSRVGIRTMYHKVWMLSDMNCTTNAEKRELLGDRQSR